MPYFKNDIVQRFIFTYEFDFIDDDLVNLFLEHYYSFNIFCAKLSKNEPYLNIEIKRCN